MRTDLVPDDLWEQVAPLLPAAPERRHRFPGRLRVPDRTALAAVLYVLRTGVAWRDVPAETVGCSGVTAWRRLRDWTEAGVWPRLHAVLLAELRRADLLDLDDCAVDGSHVRALKGGPRRPLARRPRPSWLQAPLDRRPPRHRARRRQPPRRHPTPAATRCGPSDPRLAGTPSPQAAAPVRRPGLRLRQVPPTAVEARHQAADRPTRRRSRFGLGKVRWVVERAFAWLHQFKRLRIRYERRADLHQGLLELACSLICLRRLRTAQ